MMAKTTSIAKLAKKARLIMEARGFATGTSRGYRGGKVCTLGAACIAATGSDRHWSMDGKPEDVSESEWTDYVHFRDVLAEYMPHVSTLSAIHDHQAWFSVFKWNDAEATKEDVIELFRRVEKEHSSER